ncbi:hypothetical protein PLESTB_000166100 [Pleodorina starrii]|uniref:Uncharacterized protein n=1 Tax=Pleodorina starrii TaxID=330485 RepID=A0A9W6BBC9_9CHLO|nr:hypothetical protein PLESTB_000166100 [Pleodorina starrii]
MRLWAVCGCGDVGPDWLVWSQSSTGMGCSWHGGAAGVRSWSPGALVVSCAAVHAASSAAAAVAWLMAGAKAESIVLWLLPGGPAVAAAGDECCSGAPAVGASVVAESRLETASSGVPGIAGLQAAMSQTLRGEICSRTTLNELL